VRDNFVEIPEVLDWFKEDISKLESTVDSLEHKLTSVISPLKAATAISFRKKMTRH